MNIDVNKVQDRIKELMKQCGHDNSASVYTAFMQFANEFSQGCFSYWPLIDESTPQDTPILGCSDNGCIDIIQLDTPVDWRYASPPTRWQPLPKALTQPQNTGDGE